MIVSGVILPALPAERIFRVCDGDAGFKDNHWHWFHGRIWTSFRSCVMLAVAALTSASRHDILLPFTEPFTEQEKAQLWEIGPVSPGWLGPRALRNASRQE